MSRSNNVLVCVGLSLGLALGATVGAHAVSRNFNFQWETLLTGFVATLAASFTVLEMRRQIDVQVSQANKKEKRQEFAARSVLPLQVVSVINYVESCKEFLVSLLEKNQNAFDMNLSKETLKEHKFQRFNDDFVTLAQKYIEYSYGDNAVELSRFIISLQIYKSRIDEFIKNIEEHDIKNEYNNHILLYYIYELCKNTAEIKFRCENLLSFSRFEGEYKITNEKDVGNFLKIYFMKVNDRAGHSKLFSDGCKVTLMINDRSMIPNK